MRQCPIAAVTRMIPNSLQRKRLRAIRYNQTARQSYLPSGNRIFLICLQARSLIGPSNFQGDQYLRCQDDCVLRLQCPRQNSIRRRSSDVIFLRKSRGQGGSDDSFKLNIVLRAVLQLNCCLIKTLIHLLQRGSELRDEAFRQQLVCLPNQTPLFCTIWRNCTISWEVTVRSPLFDCNDSSARDSKMVGKLPHLLRHARRFSRFLQTQS